MNTRFAANALLDQTSPRHENFEGRDHLVVPVVALVAGVVNGELAPADEIEASLPAWDGVPFTVNHPMRGKSPISANSPAVLETQAIGRIFNSEFSGNKLRAEIWIDIAKCRALGGKALEILRRVEEGEALEVSTGYFRDVEDGAGQVDGKAYNGVQRNLRPNHLAGLPDDQGACNWSDGCGAPRVNSEKRKPMKAHVRAALAALVSAIFPQADAGKLAVNLDELAAGDKDRALQAALTAMGKTNCYVMDIFDTFFIYSDPSWPGPLSKYYRMDYTIDEAGKVTISGAPVEVQRKTEYIMLNAATGSGQPPAANKSNQEAVTMTKAEKIQMVINCPKNPFRDADRPALELLPEPVLDQLMAPAAEPAPAVNTAPAPPATPAAPAIPEGMALVTNDQKAFLDKAMANQARQKTEIVTRLAVNARNGLPKETLEAMTVETLQAHERAIAPENYLGRGAPITNTTDVSKLPAPPCVLGAPPATGK